MLLSSNTLEDLIAALTDGFGTSETVQRLSAPYILAALICGAVCGLVIYLVYRYFYAGIVYSDNFNMLLILITVMTALIIMTISANIVLSLGMVGALSIVRFRTAIKDPLDLGFLFWSIAAGITCGAGLFATAFVGTAFIAVLYMLLTVAKKERKNYLLIVRYSEEAESNVSALLGTMKYKLKSKTVSGAETELTAEIKIKRNDAECLSRFKAAEGVITVTLLEYTGEFMN
ncbi:MAG: DUF4956 domain-containing protein [Oscillospiraceae bacterium]|jgi:uncharacterized membrane protein YhiD involved in acid resistance|nr:DUF4956 domain-containing protein [Oscillospiraceae bacterium]